MISTVEYFQETVKGVYVIWQGEKKRCYFCLLKDLLELQQLRKKQITG